jgi:multiple sugar transport system substrate-binding protein
MRVTLALRALAVLLALVTASGCVPAPTAAPASTSTATGTAQSYPPPLTPDQKVSISFTNYNVAQAGIGKEATEQLVNEFMQQHPNIDVQFRPVLSSDITTKTQAEVVAGNPPDLAQLGMADVEFIASDLGAKPLDTIVPNDEFQTYVRGEYPLHPRGLKLAELSGRLYGIPYVFSTPVLFYNADLFRQAGLDPNSPPTTWKQVKTDGQQIKERTGKLGIDIGCMGPAAADWCWQALVLSNGGRVMSEDRLTLMFGEEGSVGAASMWQDLVQSGVHSSSITTDFVGDGFGAGKAAMYLQTSAVQSALIAAAAGKWELRSAMMPTFDDKPAKPTNSGSALFILANDPAKQRAAWELMKYLTSEHGYTIIQSKIGYLPLRPGIVDDPRYLKDWVAQNPLVLPNLKQLDELEPWVGFPGPNYATIRTTMMKAVESVVMGGADAGTTLQDAQARASQMMPGRS